MNILGSRCQTIKEESLQNYNELKQQCEKTEITIVERITKGDLDIANGFNNRMRSVEFFEDIYIKIHPQIKEFVFKFS